MRIKSFYSDSMDVALQSASKELGDEALILNTREAPKEFRHFGRYEVVCAVADAPATPPMRPMARDLSQPAELVMLVGPSGAGKSITCAKIAIHSKFSLGKNPAVLSWDTGRVGGTDSLQSYCSIAGLAFEQVSSEKEFTQALNSMSSHDLVLVDTPPLEGSDALHEEILRSLNRHSEAEVHLVISSTFSLEYISTCERVYSRLVPTCLLPTHLDEARMDLTSKRMDALRSLSIRWCGTGRSVPEDLHEAGQVIEKAAALTGRVPKEDGYQIASIQSNAEMPTQKALATSPSSRKSLEGILARFRRADLNSLSSKLNTGRSSAA